MKILLRMSPLLLLLLCACPSLDTQYVEADAANFEAISGAYLKYVESDATLSLEEKKRRRNKITVWAMRIQRARGAAK